MAGPAAGPRAVFRGRLSEILGKVDSGEFIPKLQASHAPPCKFWTAFSVINGIRQVVPLIHGQTRGLGRGLDP